MCLSEIQTLRKASFMEVLVWLWATWRKKHKAEYEIFLIRLGQETTIKKAVRESRERRGNDCIWGSTPTYAAVYLWCMPLKQLTLTVQPNSLSNLMLNVFLLKSPGAYSNSLHAFERAVISIYNIKPDSCHFSPCAFLRCSRWKCCSCWLRLSSAAEGHVVHLLALSVQWSNVWGDSLMVE